MQDHYLLQWPVHVASREEMMSSLWLTGTATCITQFEQENDPVTIVHYLHQAIRHSIHRGASCRSILLHVHPAFKKNPCKKTTKDPKINKQPIK